MAAAENKTYSQAQPDTTQPDTMQQATHPGTSGNPSGEKTSENYRTFGIPNRFENPDCFEGYQNKPQHPMYTTTSMVYGAKKPTVHTVPTSFHCKCQKFSEHLGLCGNYTNQGLNTAIDKSTV